MKILLATYWAVPGKGDCHTYIDLLKTGLESKGHKVDILSHDMSWQNVYLNKDMKRSVYKGSISNPMSREVLIYYNVHYKDFDNWIVWQEVDRYTFELAAAAIIDPKQYDVIHSQDIFSSRAMSRIMSSQQTLITTIHGLYLDAAKAMGQITEDNTPKRKYLSAMEYYGVMSSDVTIVPERLKKVYTDKFSVPEKQLITSPYVLNKKNELIEKTLGVYQKLRKSN